MHSLARTTIALLSFGMLLSFFAAWAIAEPEEKEQLLLECVGLQQFVPGHHARLNSGEDPTKRLEIAYGDPLAVQITLTNRSDHPTPEMPISLDPRWNASALVIRHPGGKRSLAWMNDQRVRARGRVGSMAAGESISSTVYAYADAASELDGEPRYLFPEPGEYQVMAVYRKTMKTPARLEHDPAKGSWSEQYIEHALAQVDDPDLILLSEPIAVIVGEPFDGWEELCELGLFPNLSLYNPTIYDVPAKKLMASELAKVDDLVRRADRPWLTAWYEQSMREVEESRVPGSP